MWLASRYWRRRRGRLHGFTSLPVVGSSDVGVGRDILALPFTLNAVARRLMRRPFPFHDPQGNCRPQSVLRMSCEGIMTLCSMVLEMDLVGQTSIALGMRTTDRLAIWVVAQMLPIEVPSESVPIPETLLALLKRQFRVAQAKFTLCRGASSRELLFALRAYNQGSIHFPFSFVFRVRGLSTAVDFAVPQFLAFAKYRDRVDCFCTALAFFR